MIIFMINLPYSIVIGARKISQPGRAPEKQPHQWIIALTSKTEVTINQMMNAITHPVSARLVNAFAIAFSLGMITLFEVPVKAETVETFPVLDDPSPWGVTSDVARSSVFFQQAVVVTTPPLMAATSG